MAKSKWGCCIPELNSDDVYVVCTECNKNYHYACLSLDEMSLSLEMQAIWSCPECIRNTPKPTKKDDTPVRNVTITRGNRRPVPTSPQTERNQTITRAGVRETMQDVMNQNMKDILTKMQDTICKMFDKQLKPIKDELFEIKESMNFINSQYEDMKKDNESCKLKILELETRNDVLQCTVNDLSQRVNQMEQHTRQNNVELQCVPEGKNENLVKIVFELSKVVGCQLKESDILYCSRTAKLNRTSPRPRSIIVQLASPGLRDQFLAATITYNKGKSIEKKLNSTSIGISGKCTPIFVAEHLSPTNKALHAAARSRAKETGYKFVWVRNGRIFMRKREDTDHVLVKSMDMLNNIH